MIGIIGDQWRHVNNFVINQFRRPDAGSSDGSSTLAIGNMPKRAATDARPGSEKASRGASDQAREKPTEDEIGEFEDAWEDEIDDDDAAQSDGVCVIFCSRPVHSALRCRACVGSHADKSP